VTRTRALALWAVALSGCATARPLPLVAPLELAAPRPRVSEVVLRCSEPDAEVSLDGVPQGTCADFSGEPRGLGLGRGPRRVQVRKKGFQGWDSVLEADGTRVVMNVSLIPSGGGAP
jgi:hypothetical protein